MNNTQQLKELASTMSILYVEDEKKIREEIESLLKKFFDHVDSAKNGREGLDLYEQNSYDIVLTDILMPVMEGEDMMEQIRQKHPLQVIIINTAYDYKDFLVPQYPNGANFFLPKPPSHDAIVETLLAACKQASPGDTPALSIENRVALLEQRVTQLEAALACKG